RESLQPRITANGRWLSRKLSRSSSEILPCSDRRSTNLLLPSLRSASASSGVRSCKGLPMFVSLLARRSVLAGLPSPCIHRRLLVIPGQLVNVTGIQGQQLECEDRVIRRQVFGGKLKHFHRLRLSLLVSQQPVTPVLTPLRHQDPPRQFSGRRRRLKRQCGRPS